MAAKSIILEDGLTEEEKKMSPEIKNLIVSLPREKLWTTTTHHASFFQNFWCASNLIQPITYFLQHFQAKDDEIIVATFPKSGTTWVKALAFAITKRHRFSPSHHNQNHPLLHSNPHTLVPFAEVNLYGDIYNQNHNINLPTDDETRLFGTHIPYASLSPSIKSSNCKIIYLCRNPFDNFVSLWFHVLKLNEGNQLPATFEEAFENYCKGISWFGPFWSHMLGYWKQSNDTPNKVMFLHYEDLKEDTKFHVKRIAEFLDCPFSSEEESNGLIEDIIQLCSLQKMKDLEINKSGKLMDSFENKHLFRKGEIGDWVNHLSPSMIEKLSNIIQEKLGGSGLSFKLLPIQGEKL